MRMRTCIPPKASRAPCGLAESPLLLPSLCSPAIPWLLLIQIHPASPCHRALSFSSFTPTGSSPHVSVSVPGLKWHLSITLFFPTLLQFLHISYYFPTLHCILIFFCDSLLWNRNSSRTGALSDLFIAFFRSAQNGA